MNKSKILKRSLAIILAVMMMVAMIPLSASAAAAPVISELTVQVKGSTQQQKATLSGTDYAVEVPASPSIEAGVTVYITLAAGSGKIYHAYTTDNKATEQAKESNGQWKFALTTDEITAKKASFDLYDADVVKVGTYTISLSVTEAERDTAVTSVTVDSQYGSTVLDGNTYTIIVPYTSETTTYKATVKLNSAKSRVDKASNNDNTKVVTVAGAAGTYTLTGLVLTPSTGEKSKFTVASEGGTTKEYYINLVKAQAFTAFSVAGERKAADIIYKADFNPRTNGIAADYNADGVIIVHMPYGTKSTAAGAWKFTPSYTSGYESVTLNADAVGGDDDYKLAFKSGEEVDLAKFAAVGASAIVTGNTVKLKLTYTGGASEKWEVRFETPAANPVAEITSATVGNYVGTVDEDARTISLALPSDLRIAGQTVKFGISDGSFMQVVGVDDLPYKSGSAAEDRKNKADGDFGDAKAEANILKITMDATVDQYTLRVTAGGAEPNAEPEVKDYTLRIVTQEAKPAAITSAKLEIGDKEYAASIGSDYTVNFVLPYKYSTGIAGAKFYYEITSGSVLKREAEDPTSTIKASGEAIEAGDPIWPAAPFSTTAKSATKKLVVETSATNMNKYTVTIKLETASAAAELSGLKIVDKGVTEVSKITSSNSYDAVGTTDFVVTIPSRYYADYTTYNADASKNTLAKLSGTLSEGATLYYLDADKKMYLLGQNNADGELLTTAQLPWAPNDVADKHVAYDGVTPADKPTALQLVVVSEGIKVESGTTVFGDDFMMENNGLYKRYTLVVKKASANTGNQIKSISLYDKTTKETVSANAANYGFTLTVPFHFTEHDLMFSYESDNYEIVKVNGTVVKPLVIEDDGTLKAGTGDAVAIDYNAETKAAKLVTGTYADRARGTEIKTFISTPEANDDQVTWTVVLKVSEPDIGAELESVKVGEVTAKPDSSNKVTLTLPADTEITHIQPELTVSKNATAYAYSADAEGHKGNVHVNGESAYNLTTSKKFVVESEDKNHTTTYTLEIKLDEKPVETGAELKSVKVGAVTATPDSSKRVTLTLPAGTDLTKVAPEFTLAKNATAAVDGTAHVNGTSTYDMTKAITVVVTAEDGKTTATYTVEAKLADDEDEQDPFTDVKKTPTAWYYDMLKQAKKDGIIKGFDDGTFRPNAAISRQDFAVMLVNVLKPEDLANYTTPTFTDCTATYSQQAIAYLEAKKIVNGYGDGTFKPTKAITRAEVASVISKLLNLEDGQTTPFADDATLPGWAKDVIYRCKAAGIFTGDEAGKFNASKNMTRAEAAQVMVRLQPKLK